MTNLGVPSEEVEIYVPVALGSGLTVEPSQCLATLKATVNVNSGGETACDGLTLPNGPPTSIAYPEENALGITLILSRSFKSVLTDSLDRDLECQFSVTYSLHDAADAQIADESIYLTFKPYREANFGGLPLPTALNFS